MDEKVYVNILPDEALYLERLYFEYNGLFVLCKQFASDTGLKPDTENYELLLKRYVEAYSAYMLAMNYLISKHAKEYNSDDYNVTIEFDQNLMVISKKENGCSCSCSVK